MMSDKWNYTIEKWVIDKDDVTPSGVIVVCDNGDRQYLTIEEFRKFTRLREEAD
jgi:hypothetical protein